MTITIPVDIDGAARAFQLQDDELSIASDGSSYLNNASRGFIADQVELTLQKLTEHNLSKVLFMARQATWVCQCGSAGTVSWRDALDEGPHVSMIELASKQHREHVDEVVA